MLSAALIFIISFSVQAAPTWYPLPSEACTFGKLYPKAQRLLFAFDYGHALVYERLLQNRGLILKPKDFEKKILADVMAILKNPPNVKVDESDIAPQYVLDSRSEVVSPVHTRPGRWVCPNRPRRRF